MKALAFFFSGGPHGANTGQDPVSGSMEPSQNTVKYGIGPAQPPYADCASRLTSRAE